MLQKTPAPDRCTSRGGEEKLPLTGRNLEQAQADGGGAAADGQVKEKGGVQRGRTHPPGGQPHVAGVAEQLRMTGASKALIRPFMHPNRIQSALLGHPELYACTHCCHLAAQTVQGWADGPTPAREGNTPGDPPHAQWLERAHAGRWSASTLPCYIARTFVAVGAACERKRLRQGLSEVMIWVRADSEDTKVLQKFLAVQSRG